jgi:hypothetical protein
MNKLKQNLLLLGGFLGFCVVFATGILLGHGMDQILFDSALGCLFGGVALRWIAALFIDSFVAQRRAALTQTQAADKKTTPTAVASAATAIIKGVKS